jgi:hypothetical protein
MFERLRNPAAILIAVALLLAAGAGFATGAKLVNSKDVKNNSLTGQDIKDNSITTKEAKNNNLTGKDLKDNSVASGDIKSSTIVSGDVKNETLVSGDVKNETLTSGDVKNETLTSGDVKNETLTSGDIKNETLASGDIKNGTVGSADLANGSVGASELAPGAVAFPNSLWGPMIRNQTGAAHSGGQTGPTGQPLGDGSLALTVEGPSDLAAFGNSFDFAGVELEQITNVSYSTYNADDPPEVRPSLRMEIDPHLLADDTFEGRTEFTTLVHEPAVGAAGWENHANALTDEFWYLTGDEGDTTGCTQADSCTFTEVLTALDEADDDPAAPAISTGVYFGLGQVPSAPAVTAVDAFVFNGFQFDFEPMGVFLRVAP